MTTKYMRTFANAAAGLALWTLLPISLALTALSQEAAATPFSETVMGGGILIGNRWVSNIPLSVPPPGGANPNDWGMCGILSLSGTFDNDTVAEISVQGGAYVLYLNSSTRNGLTVGVTCVNFSDFTGLPPAKDAVIFLPPTVVPSSGGVEEYNHVGGFPQACIWAGLAGGFTKTTQEQPSPGRVSAKPYLPGAKVPDSSPYTLVSAISQPSTTLSTYAFCFSFTSPVSWTYSQVNLDLTNPGPPLNLKIPTNQNWCYMDGIAAFEQNVDLGLLIISGDYYLSSTPSGDVDFNCLPLKQ